MAYAKPYELPAAKPFAPPLDLEPAALAEDSCVIRAGMPGQMISAAALHAAGAVARRAARWEAHLTVGEELEIEIPQSRADEATQMLAEAGFSTCRGATDEEPCGALRHGHVGIFEGAQRGLTDVGIAVPAGVLTAYQLHGLAQLAESCGAGHVRLTRWQNAIVPGVLESRLGPLQRRVRLMGLGLRAASAAACVVACGDSTGTLRAHALDLCRHLDRAVEMDTPIDIHLSAGPCRHGMIADIALVGLESFDVLIGGTDASEVWRDMPAVDAPGALARLLNGYRQRRLSANESFLSFARRHEPAALRAMLVGAA
jgi:sulfite reductase beta subunit-like hemoprotein